MPEKEEKPEPPGRTEVQGGKCFQVSEMNSMLCLLTEMKGLEDVSVMDVMVIGFEVQSSENEYLGSIE